MYSGKTLSSLLFLIYILASNTSTCTTSVNVKPELIFDRSPCGKDFSNDDRVSHECDETRYYTCKTCGWVLVSCPPDFIFDPYKKKCVTDDTIPRSTSSPPIFSNTPSSPNDQEITTLYHKNECFGHKIGDIYASDEDCTAFLICAEGGEIKKYCPLDKKGLQLYWNDIQKICDKPQNSACYMRHTTKETSSYQNIVIPNRFMVFLACLLYGFIYNC